MSNGAEEVANHVHSYREAEYISLRSELLKRIEFKYQLITITLIVAGTFITVGLTETTSATVLLVYPLLALFLAGAWKHNGDIINEIGSYIRNFIEPNANGGLGWETYLKDNPPHSLSYRFSAIFATGGVFVSTQIITLIIVLFKSFESSLTVIELVLFLCDIVAVGITLCLLRNFTKMER